MCEKYCIMLESHDHAIMTATQAIIKLTEELPDGPLTDQLMMIADTQLAIIKAKACGQHFGTKQLIEFMQECKGIADYDFANTDCLI